MRRIAIAVTTSVAAGLIVAASLAGQQAPATPEAPDRIAADGTVPVIAQQDFTMNMGARIQVRYTYLDEEGLDSFGSYGIRRGRMSLSGFAYRHFDYAIQLELAGSSVRLIDANIRYRIRPMATVWFGQGKAPFGRQQLNSSGNLHLVDRAITDGRFAPGRQQGLALLGRNSASTFEYGVGSYNGNGINAPNPNDRFMFVGRMVWTPLGAYAAVESAHDYPADPRVALGAAALHNTEGTGAAAVDIARLGLEAAFKLRGLNGTSEIYFERAEPETGDASNTSGWYLQAGYLLPGRKHEVIGRIAMISPDTENNTDTIETGFGYSLYLNGHRAKLQTDLRNIEYKATPSLPTFSETVIFEELLSEGEMGTGDVEGGDERDRRRQSEASRRRAELCRRPSLGTGRDARSRVGRTAAAAAVHGGVQAAHPEGG